MVRQSEFVLTRGTEPVSLYFLPSPVNSQHTLQDIHA